MKTERQKEGKRRFNGELGVTHSTRERERERERETEREHRKLYSKKL